MKNALPYLLVALLAMGLFVVLGYAAVHGIESLGDAVDPPFTDAVADAEVELFPSGDSAAVAPSPAPSSLLAPFPPSIADYAFDRYRYEPDWLIRERLAMGDPETEAAMSRALRIETSRDDADTALPLLLDVDPTPEHCAWLRREVASDELVVGRDGLVIDLGRCEDEESVTLLETRADALAGWIVLADSEPAVLAPFDGARVVAAVLALRAADDPRSGSTFAGALAALPDRERTLALDRLRPHLGGEVYSWWETAAEVPRTGPTSPLDERVRNAPLRLAVLASRIEDTEAGQLDRALVRCAADREKVNDWQALECLRVLVGRRPELARAAAASLVAGDVPSADLDEAVAALSAWGSEARALARLRELGLLSDEEPAPGLSARISVRGLLEARRRAACFPPPDAATMVTALLVRFAHLARPALDDAVFDLPDGEPTAEGGAYRIAAYLDGSEVSIWSSGVSASANLYAILSLLNRALTMRGDTRRYVALEPGDCAAFGPPDAFLDLRGSGFRVPAGARVLRRRGRRRGRAGRRG